MLGDKGLQLAQYTVKIIRHFAFCLIRRVGGNCTVDRFVLAKGSCPELNETCDPRLSKAENFYSPFAQFATMPAIV